MNTTTTWHPRLVLPIQQGRDHIIGSVDAPATLVEYGDFECPSCGMAYPIVKEVLQSLGDRVCFVFRNFPISTLHPHAELAAEAAEAAGDQDRFWEMHDRLFENQDRLRFPDLLEHAAAIGLDVPRFQSGLEQHSHQERVREDFMSGVRSGVNGTPTFYIEGVRHDQSWDADTLTAALLAGVPNR
jgi:NhaA family Na+:H+ antiporter